jgi:hypothetical protein
MDTLSHRWDLRKGEIVKNQIRKHERKYVDFIVSGRPLSEVFKTKENDMISMFGWGINTDYEKRTIKEFIKQESSELETGRTVIYGCSECGDIGCGAITAEIIDLGDKIIWKEFGYENNYSVFDLDDYKHILPFLFDKKEYLEEFEKIARELLEIPRKKDD